MAEYIDRDKAFDAVDERIDELKGDKEFNIVKEICMHIASIPTANVIPIPEGATNGNMIKAMFPNLVNSNMDLVDAFNNAKKWWNAPYKRGRE